MKTEKRLKQQRDFASKAYYARVPVERIIHNVRHRAKQKGIVFNLKAKDIVIPATCPILGFPIALNHPNIDMRPSLDRWDNSLGYVPGNVRVISYRANRIKNDATAAELYAVAAYAAGL